MRIAIVGFALIVATALPSAALAGGEGGLSKAPELTLPDIHGKDFKITWADSKATLVNFWAVWCVPCQDEIPQISDLVTEFKGRGFRAIGIAVESGDSAAVRSFLAENPELGVNYPVLIGNLESIMKYGNVDSIPTTFLVDSKGAVQKTYIGATPGFGKAVGADITALVGKGESRAPCRPQRTLPKRAAGTDRLLSPARGPPGPWVLQDPRPSHRARRAANAAPAVFGEPASQAAASRPRPGGGGWRFPARSCASPLR